MTFAWIKKLSQSFSGVAAPAAAAVEDDGPFEKDRSRLFAAARSNDVPIVDEITQKYPDEFAAWKSKEGGVLKIAQTSGSFDVFKIMIERGCNINENYGDRWTPLLRAISAKQEDFFNYLLEKGASLGETAVTQRTSDDHATMGALHMAISKGDKKMMMVLLEHGASPAVTAFPDFKKCETALDYAERKEQFVLADILKRADKIRAEYLAKGIPAPAPATTPVAANTNAAPPDDGKIAVLNPLQLKKTRNAATGART